MRIEAGRAVSVSQVRKDRSVGADGFAPSSSEAVSTAAPLRGVHSLAPLDAVLALQVDGGDRRRRQVRRGAAALDALDGLALALLDGGSQDQALDRLEQALREREPTDEQGLDDVLSEIDVRAAVELAKRERRRHAQRAHA